MMENESSEKLMTQKGIGLFKIDYEMDIQGQNRNYENTFQAGIIAYGSDEATKTLSAFLRKSIKGFRGFKINQLSFEGYCHAISDNVREQIIKGAIAEGKVFAAVEEFDEPTPKPTKSVKKEKKSIIK